MNIAVYLAHPSQYYVFRQTVKKLRENGHTVFLFIKSKDILEELLRSDNEDYVNIFAEEKRSGFIGLVSSVFKRNYAFLKHMRKKKIELLVSAASDSSQASFLKRIPSIIFNDDDAPVIKKSALFGWPFSSVIFAPPSCEMGYWVKKTIFYKAYQKLFYLHPKYFKADKSIVDKYISDDKPYFLIRSVSLTAHHDKDIRGLNNELVAELIGKLTPHGQVFISSERPLPESLEKYRLQINPLDMHHLIYFATLIIGDSQSMAQEAALMGTPSLRYNDFVGRIGVMEELEHKYCLTFGILPDHPEVLLKKAEDLATLKDKKFFRDKAQAMLTEMIDPTDMLVWFIENYPSSARIMKENPDYQYRFR
jgi:predicted glycosyltransferase